MRPYVRPSGRFLITFSIVKTHDSKGFGRETGSKTGPKVTKVSAPDQSENNWYLVTLVTYFRDLHTIRPSGDLALQVISSMRFEALK